MLAWLGAASAVLLVGSLAGIGFLVARIPEDYFASRDTPPAGPASRHPIARFALRVARNAVAAVLIVAGVAMLVLPGQGIITILVGLILLDFPGKRRLELALVRIPRVRSTLDWIRRKAGRPPLRVAPPED